MWDVVVIVYDVGFVFEFVVNDVECVFEVCMEIDYVLFVVGWV